MDDKVRKLMFVEKALLSHLARRLRADGVKPDEIVTAQVSYEGDAKEFSHTTRHCWRYFAYAKGRHPYAGSVDVDVARLPLVAEEVLAWTARLRERFGLLAGGDFTVAPYETRGQFEEAEKEFLAMPQADGPYPVRACDALAGFLNLLLRMDPEAVSALVNHRVPVNKTLADGKAVVVLPTPDGDRLGVLGVMNGLLLKVGPLVIAAEYEGAVGVGPVLLFSVVNSGPGVKE